MFNLKTTILIAMGVLSATAAPTVHTSSDGRITAGQNTAFVFACQNARWGNPCQTFGSNPGTCFNVPGSYNDRISSIRNLDKNRFHCVWYEHSNCGGRSYGNQEDANLHDGNGFFSDRISSWRCNTRQFRTAAGGSGAVEVAEQQ
ncbi:hypothetical protein QC762_401176 [Podospora pseudocomata]|uniref:Uncharacterized protein n=1 Tax=Podospora pseudocomata TaxID=2093779 RepID=A0ABR0GEB5_9PEZI|nr:hypothetical protein QC762_401176 [Podospora pseudocomata]